MKLGRNDPCPCGSGKKYKHCHLQSHEAPSPQELTWRRLQRVIEGLPQRLANAAEKHFGPDAIEEAWAEFNVWETEEPFDAQSPYLSVFVPWFLYNWLPDPEETDVPVSAQSVTAAQAYMQVAGARVDPLLRRYVEACCAAPFSFHEIAACEPGRGFRLRDVLLGSEVDVIEGSGSVGALVGDIMFAKVVPIDGIAVLDGCTPVRIPPKDKPDILAFRAKLPAQRALCGAELLKNFDIELRELYLSIADPLLYPELPELANTDGDPLEFHELVYDLDSPAAAFEALKPLAVGMFDDEIMQGAVFDESGELTGGEILWRREGNAMHSTWESTTLGSLKIERGRLIAAVNSAQRAEQLRVLIDNLAGSNARYRTTVVQSVESMLEREQTPQERAAARREREESEQLAAQPEVQAAMAQMLRAHYRDWLDQKIPALGERTPREAARDPDGREAVEALILQIERDGAFMQPPMNPQIVSEMREALGLDK